MNHIVVRILKQSRNPQQARPVPADLVLRNDRGSQYDGGSNRQARENAYIRQSMSARTNRISKCLD
jgi:transposase InsO family protein